MISYGLLVFVVATASATIWCDKNVNDVRILHVVFRHGDRTPINFDYPKNPYKNVTFSRGFGELTLTGKRREYELGSTLACRYEEILSKYPYYEILKATSSDFNRTRESLLAVLAGMFPPGKKEKISPLLDWQPIASDYIRFAEDDLLSLLKCTKPIIFKDTLDAVDPKSRRIIKEIEARSGFKINNFATFIILRDYMQVMNEVGYAIPKWAKPYWPEPFRTFANLGWHEVFDTKLNHVSGNLLNKIAEDSLQPLGQKDKKVYLYSGHDTNVGGILAALGALQDQIVEYSAYVAFEVIEDIEGKRSVMVYFDNRDDQSPRYLEVPGCGSPCTVEKFLEFANKFYLGDKWCT